MLPHHESRLKVLNYTSHVFFIPVYSRKKCWFYTGMSDGRVNMINFIEFLPLSIPLKKDHLWQNEKFVSSAFVDWSTVTVSGKSVWTVSVRGWANCILFFHREPFLVENYWQSYGYSDLEIWQMFSEKWRKPVSLRKRKIAFDTSDKMEAFK